MKRHTIGVDPLPVLGSYIVILTLDDTNFYSNKIEMQFGKVEADFPSKYDSIDDALSDNVPVCIDPEGAWYDDSGEIHSIAYWVIEPDQFYLYEGMQWVYFHDFVFDTIRGAFPFYNFEYMKLAHQHQWVKIVYHSTVEMEYPSDGKFIRHTYVVDFNGDIFKAGWNEFPGNIYFTGVYDPADFGEPIDTPFRIHFQ